MFEFATANRIVFGAGKALEAGGLVRPLGRRALLVTGRGHARFSRVLDSLRAENIRLSLFVVEGEPTVIAAALAADQARAENCDVVIGLGGGSAMDTAKAAAALLTNREDIFNYLEVIGLGRPLASPAAPCVAIPTTAGTGSEVTRNAVLASPEHKLKVSLRHPSMLPRLAIVDPELTWGSPPAISAASGFDALAQLIEPFVCLRANPITDGLCREGIWRVAQSLERVCLPGEDWQAREHMAVASLFGGIALANAGLGAVHGLASPIGGRFAAPHGAVCGILLAPAMERNIAALAARGDERSLHALARYDGVARILTGETGAGAPDGVEWVRRLAGKVGLRRLRAFGVESSDLIDLATAALATSSMKANPMPLTRDEVAAIAADAL